MFPEIQLIQHQYKPQMGLLVEPYIHHQYIAYVNDNRTLHGFTELLYIKYVKPPSHRAALDCTSTSTTTMTRKWHSIVGLVVVRRPVTICRQQITKKYVLS